MGLPTMIGMMINALYNLVDAYFVGGLGTSQKMCIRDSFTPYDEEEIEVIRECNRDKNIF